MSVRVIDSPENRSTLVVITRLPAKTERAISDALHEIGRENVEHMRGLIKAKNKTGLVYVIGGRRHVSSAPGEAPASFSGRLSRTAGYRESDGRSSPCDDKRSVSNQGNNRWRDTYHGSQR